MWYPYFRSDLIILTFGAYESYVANLPTKSLEYVSDVKKIKKS